MKLECLIPNEPDRTTVILGEGVLNRATEMFGGYQNSRLLLVSDEQVAPLYAMRLQSQLADNGYRPHLLTISAGDKYKTLDTLAGLYVESKKLGLERGDAVVAVGGGAVGDIAGMLAGTYLRGLDFIQIPTSLVAMVSASTGGKAAVNFDGCKNLIGVFKHPSIVLADTGTLATLPVTEFRSGLGELITVGVLGAPEIFEALERFDLGNLDSLIAIAVQCKIDLVEADPFDRKGIRAKLNLGHTFGHALEKLSDFTIPHGEGVAIGLYVASKVSAAVGRCPQPLPARVRKALGALKLPTTFKGFSPEDVIEAMRSDKKRQNGRLRFVLPVAIGKVVIVEEEDLPPGLLMQALGEVASEA